MADSDNSLIVPEEVIKDKIYLLRGQKIMLDKDLAELYGINPIRLREQVKRNADRFPSRFMFQLTEEEASHMVSQNAISSKKHLGGTLLCFYWTWCINAGKYPEEQQGNTTERRELSEAKWAYAL